MTNTPRGAALAWSCAACHDRLFAGAGHEYAPGRWSLGAIHGEHLPELVAAGWIVTYDDPDEPEVPDVVCPHYPALCSDR